MRSTYLLTSFCEPCRISFAICERSVNFCGVEKGDSAFYSRLNQRNHFLFVFRRTQPKAALHKKYPFDGYGSAAGCAAEAMPRREVHLKQRGFALGSGFALSVLGQRPDQGRSPNG